MEPASSHSILYHTQSSCPKCALLERRGFEMVPATVEQDESIVSLNVQCPSHGIVRSLLSSDATIFKRMLSLAEGSLPATQGKCPTPDVEEIASGSVRRGDEDSVFPLFVEIPICDMDGKIHELGRIEAAVRVTLSSVPKKRRVCLRVVSKLVSDLRDLNAILTHISKHVKDAWDSVCCSHVILEITFERLIALAKMDDSCLLCPNVHPMVKMYVPIGGEEQAKTDIKGVCKVCSDIRGLQLIISLVLDPSPTYEMPDLGKIIPFLRTVDGLVRGILISRERSPSTILSELRHDDPQKSLKYIANLDMMLLVNALINGLRGEVRAEDLYPISMWPSFQPFLNMLGYEGYELPGVSPLCAFGTVLVNTEYLSSIPISSLFDLDQLYREMAPVARKMREKQRKGKTGWGVMTARKVRNIVRSSRRSQIKGGGLVPDHVMSYVVDEEKEEIAMRTVLHSQWILIHNNMDIAGIDQIRTNTCASCCLVPSRKTQCVKVM